MKLLVAVFFLVLNLSVFAQKDTVDVYVINNTNRLIQVGAEYAFEYRNLKSLATDVRSIHFDSKKELDKFFDLCQKALDQDQGTITEDYNVSRNKLSKNVVRVNDKNSGYFLLKYETLEHMRDAAYRSE